MRSRRAAAHAGAGERVVRRARHGERACAAQAFAASACGRGSRRRARITVTPLSWGLLAASLVLFAALGAAHASVDLHRIEQAARRTRCSRSPHSCASPISACSSSSSRPDAKKVSVVGDFNGWDASHASFQAQHRGGGVWSVTAPVPVGHHRYSFVVDDSLWVADPTAPRVIDNDYGMANSAIVVEEQK